MTDDNTFPRGGISKDSFRFKIMPQRNYLNKSLVEQKSFTIKRQSHISGPITSDATIMDDTVVIMDSVIALMGGLVTIQPAMRQSVSVVVPRVKIRKER